jgi:hypothetical protein
MLTLTLASLARGFSLTALAFCATLFAWSGTARAQPAPAETVVQPAPVASPAPATPVSAAPPDAPAVDTNHATMNNNLSLFGAIGYGYGYGTGYGLGARYQLVFADHVLKLPPGKHDEFGVEFGFDYYHVSYSQAVLGSSFDWSYNEYTPVVGITWNFWLSDKLMLYPKFDFGYRFISWNNDLGGYDAGVGHVYFQGTGGVAYDLGPVKLRAELGWASVRLGAAIRLF